jgi:hypothetical protein
MASQQEELQPLLKKAEESLKQSQEQQIRESKFAYEANERFVKNLAAFEKYYPDIAKSISSFNTRQDFCIHVTKSGDGNFFPNGKKVPLYDDAPIEQVKAQVKKYTEKPSFGRTDYTGTQEWQSDDPRIHIQYMRRLSSILNRVGADKFTPLSSLPEHYPTALIFGIGLGYHIPELLNHHSFDYMFICEPDFELFFASLFCIEWFDILKVLDAKGACLFLSLGVNYDEFFDEVYRIANEIGSFCAINSFCYQHYPSQKVNELISSFFDNYYQLQQGYGFYNDAITGLAHVIKNIEKGADFLFSSPQKMTLLADIPVFVVGNGPSLDNAIELIKQYQSKVIIFAAGTALQSLLKVGIVPDFHVLVERTKATYDILKLVEPEQGYKNLNLLTVDVMYPDVLDLYKWSGVGLKGPEAATAFMSLYSYVKCGKQVSELPASGPFVSNTAFSYAVMLGFKQVYLIGVDNGYSLEGKTHSDLSIYKDTKIAVEQGANIRFDGNLDNDVMATSLMAMSKTSFDRLISGVSDKIDVFNVGEGAKLRGALPLREQDLLLTAPIDNKLELIESIKTQFFESVDADNIEQFLGFDDFDGLCDYIYDIGKRPITSRDEANANLIAQQRVVFAYKNSKTPHLFSLLKGTMLYFHCAIVSFLYQFEEEQEVLVHFNEAHELWLEFVLAAKDDFRENWNTKCDWSMPEYQGKSK